MLGKIIILLKKTQGRDKLTKFLIYLLKLLDCIKSIKNDRPTFRFERMGCTYLATHFQKARQFMRLGKFITEYHFVIKLITENTKDQFGRLAKIIIHTFFGFYWALDNLTLLSSFDLIAIPEFKMSQSAMTIKFIAMLLAGLFNIRTWMRLHHEQLSARKALKYLKGQENLNKNKKLLELVNEQWKTFLLCLKIYGDMLPTIAKSSIARKIFRFQIPRIVQALGGLINALVSCMITSL